MKVKMRERVQPKTGKVDIDYQKLHDAFFKFQTKLMVKERIQNITEREISREVLYTGIVTMRERKRWVEFEG